MMATKAKALSALRKELMDSYGSMKCKNLTEFQQRLQWLSEGMLKNHMAGKSHVINKEEIELYQDYCEKRNKINKDFGVE